MSNDLSENLNDEIHHLAEEHGLIKTTAYVRSNSAKSQSNGAKRVARHRQQKKEKGLVPYDLPIAVVEEIKAAGSFDAWIKQFQRIPSDQIKLIRQAIRVAKKVSKLPRWMKWLISKF